LAKLRGRYAEAEEHFLRAKELAPGPGVERPVNIHLASVDVLRDRIPDAVGRMDRNMKAARAGAHKMLRTFMEESRGVVWDAEFREDFHSALSLSLLADASAVAHAAEWALN